MIDKKINVLVVYDSSATMHTVCELLKRIGFERIHRAADGDEAFSKMQATQYGFIVSECNMQPMTGIQLLQKVRDDEKLQKTPFLILTKECCVDSIKAAKQAGVSDYVIEPFNADFIKQRIDHHVLQ